MGLHVIGCVICGKEFQWFSGMEDQRCPECQNKSERHKNMEDFFRRLKEELEI